MHSSLGARTAMLVVAAAVVLTACGSSGSAATSRQDDVAAKGAMVMPFDQKLTTHVFRATATGGVQRVVAKDLGDNEQISLIRSHLGEEAKRFAAGDFSDPMAIHGMKMPGLAALRRGFAAVDVRYSSLPDGARIIYTTKDSDLIAALHEWFDAQLMDHGANAHG
ncbi:MAG: aspartate carbamoyltransferase [Acidimicrobiia bacterium]|nr:aspartate carbamoyltransferase [Acidimicrobiia bacterium]